MSEIRRPHLRRALPRAARRRKADHPVQPPLLMAACKIARRGRPQTGEPHPWSTPELAEVIGELVPAGVLNVVSGRGAQTGRLTMSYAAQNPIPSTTGSSSRRAGPPSPCARLRSEPVRRHGQFYVSLDRRRAIELGGQVSDNDGSSEDRAFHGSASRRDPCVRGLKLRSVRDGALAPTRGGQARREQDIQTSSREMSRPAGQNPRRGQRHRLRADSFAANSDRARGAVQRRTGHSAATRAVVPPDPP